VRSGKAGFGKARCNVSVKGIYLETTIEALIKKLEIKSLVSLDKVARLTLDFSAEDNETIDRVNRLMRADETVEITIKSQGE